MKITLALVSALAFAQRLGPEYELIDLVNDPTDGVKSIVVDIKYSGKNNLFGKKLPGYGANKCIVTRKTARALKQVQEGLWKKGLSLIMYDCYRPNSAVREMNRFVEEAQRNPSLDKLNPPYHPNVYRSELIDQGYVGRGTSGHSNGGSVDLAIIINKERRMDLGYSPKPDVSCVGALHDMAIDFGTTWDCMDPRSGTDGLATISRTAKANRELLSAAMSPFFDPYYAEWWHWSVKGNDAKDFRQTDRTITENWPTGRYPQK